jgi:MoxR-like ATPase
VRVGRVVGGVFARGFTRVAAVITPLGWVMLGVSVRGALALVRSAKTLAAASGRHYVVPDDVKSLAEPVLAHRLVLDPEAEFDGVTPSSIIGQLLLETSPPSDRQAV